MAEPKVITVSQTAVPTTDSTGSHRPVESNSKTRTIIRVAPGLQATRFHSQGQANDHHGRECDWKGTFASGSVIVEGNDFIAEYEIDVHSIVVDFWWWQDTLYLHRERQYLRDCYIEGTWTTFSEIAQLSLNIAISTASHLVCNRAQTWLCRGNHRLRVSEVCLNWKRRDGVAYLGRPWGPLEGIYTYTVMFGIHSRRVLAFTSSDVSDLDPIGMNGWLGPKN
ncbi:hypothetical protein F3Y22_tig00110621pilonHSYRG00328 [Hibiscus syriacus]|uniref:Uncharacterized protein n=1 Tax=Hibiscus syriacus TaxID=106335 RepID=A0A6A3A2E1_HIBSY|nr:hypothetical protein F3Y22_tig00110621pilonHSYRG00328 [Hibiscus syriacus]